MTNIGEQRLHNILTTLSHKLRVEIQLTHRIIPLYTSFDQALNDLCGMCSYIISAMFCNRFLLFLLILIIRDNKRMIEHFLGSVA